MTLEEIRSALAWCTVINFGLLIADCGIVTIQTYEGITRGLFGKDTSVTVNHTKNLNQGDECCEVIISR